MKNKKLLIWTGIIVCYLLTISLKSFGSETPPNSSYLEPIVKNITYDGSELTVYYAFNYTFLQHQANGSQYPYNFVYQTKSTGQVKVNWVFDPTDSKIEINTTTQSNDIIFSVNVPKVQTIISIATAGLELIPFPDDSIGGGRIYIDPGTSPTANVSKFSFVISTAMLKKYAVKNSNRIAQHELGETGIRIYPNPVENRLYFETSGNTTGEMQIIDIQGKLHYRKQDAMIDSYGFITVQDLHPGFYILTIRTESGLKKQRFIKK